MGLLQNLSDIVELNIFVFVHGSIPNGGRESAHSKGQCNNHKSCLLPDNFVGWAKWFRPPGSLFRGARLGRNTSIRAARVGVQSIRSRGAANVWQPSTQRLHLSAAFDDETCRLEPLANPF